MRIQKPTSNLNAASAVMTVSSQKLFCDLEKIFKKALADNNYLAALKSKELQIKSLKLEESMCQKIPLIKKYTCAHDFIQHFATYADEELAQINESFSNERY